MTLTIRWFAIALTAAASFWASTGRAQDKSPSKQMAIQVLKEFQSALEAKDYKKAVTYLQPHPKVKSDAVEKLLVEYLKRERISVQGIEIMAANGKWGKLGEVFGQTRAKSLAEGFDVPVADCYGFLLKGAFNAEAAFFWNGNRLMIIRCNDIGKLRE